MVSENVILVGSWFQIIGAAIDKACLQYSAYFFIEKKIVWKWII